MIRDQEIERGIKIEKKQELSLKFFPHPAKGKRDVLMLALDGEVIPGQSSLTYEDAGNNSIKKVVVTFWIGV